MKIALIKKQATSFWKSCQSITANLEKAYQFLAEKGDLQLEVFSLSDDPGYHDLYELAEKVGSGGYSHVAWIDHYPHPHDFLKAFFEIQPDKSKCPKFIFHLFGDFVLQAPQWEALENLMEGVPFTFLSASHRQNDLINSLLDEKSNILTDTLAFPVDESFFSFSEVKRNKGRERLGILENESVFLYTGRLSYQKNIFDLIRAFGAYKKNFDSNSKLFFCGPMDDLGIPYLGKEALAGTFFFHWEECFRDPEFKSLLDEGSIQYLGNISTENLHEMYCVADLYLSFSCHNDEDYGMSPAEATVSGLPCLLSSWGGFYSFHKYFPEKVDIIPVSLGEGRQAPSQIACIKAMAAKNQKRLSLQDRKAFGEKAVLELGIKGSAQKITKVLEKLDSLDSTQIHFNEKFRKLCSHLKGNKRAPFKGPTGGYSLFYRDIYSVYTGEKS